VCVNQHEYPDLEPLKEYWLTKAEKDAIVEARDVQTTNDVGNFDKYRYIYRINPASFYSETGTAAANVMWRKQNGGLFEDSLTVWIYDPETTAIKIYWNGKLISETPGATNEDLTELAGGDGEDFQGWRSKQYIYYRGPQIEKKAGYGQDLVADPQILTWTVCPARSDLDLTGLCSPVTYKIARREVSGSGGF